MGDDRIGASGNELLVEFLLERLRLQHDWNGSLNRRASMLLALAGITLSVLLGGKHAGAEDLTVELVARAAGLILLGVSAAILLWALRRLPEAVLGDSDDRAESGLPKLGDFIAAHRDQPGDRVVVALLERLDAGTQSNEKVLGAKSKEIEFGTSVTLLGVLCVALGSLDIGLPLLVASLVLVLGGVVLLLLAVYAEAEEERT